MADQREQEIAELKARLAALEQPGGGGPPPNPYNHLASYHDPRSAEPRARRGHPVLITVAVIFGLLVLVAIMRTGAPDSGGSTAAASDDSAAAVAASTPSAESAAPVARVGLDRPWNGGPIEPQFSLSFTPSETPTISGTTNLPDGTEVYVAILRSYLLDADQRLANGLAACDVNCYPWSEKYTTINDGKFSTGPLATDAVRPDGAHGLPDGEYAVLVRAVCGPSKNFANPPPNGNYCDHLDGPLITGPGRDGLVTSITIYQTLQIGPPDPTGIDDQRVAFTIARMKQQSS